MKSTVRVILAAFIGLAAFVTPSQLSHAQPAHEIEQTPLFVSGEGGYHTYRIPAIITTEMGTVLAFCEGRKNSSSDTGDIDLLMRRSTDGGRTWGPTQVIWDDWKNTCGNPCPVIDQQTGTIWLLMTHNLGIDHESEITSGTSRGTRTVWVTHSKDEGETWADPTEITATTKRENWSWYATGPGVGIQLVKGPHAGRMLIPCDHKTLDDQTGYYSHMIYSDDGGQNWQIGGITENGVNECQVIQRTDGALMLNMRRSRTNPVEHRAVSISQDGGQSWSPLRYDQQLPSPRCQASLIRYARADQPELPWVLFSNPASTSQRVQMTVRLSKDDGETWPESLLLHEGPSAYSCLTVMPDGDVACFYERGQNHPYETITLARFSIEAFD